MKDMAPVKFQGKNGQTLAVGDMVWAKQGNEAVHGCVTGFEFREDQLDTVELSLSGGRGQARMTDFSVDDIFLTEQEVYHRVLEELFDRRNTLALELLDLDHQIVKLRMEWGERVKE